MTTALLLLSIAILMALFTISFFAYRIYEYLIEPKHELNQINGQENIQILEWQPPQKDEEIAFNEAMKNIK